MYTAYRKRDAGNGTTACNPDNEFDCEDDTCIDKSLRCDNRSLYNCKFKQDEAGCKVWSCQT